MKRDKEQLFNDCIEFFKIVENDGYLVKSNDLRRFGLTNKKVSYFWRTHKEFIYNLICQNEYKLKYPNAYKILKSNYEDGYHLLSFDEKAIQLFYTIEYEDKYLKFFSDGISVANFVKNNIGKLYAKVSEHKYKLIYPKAYLTFMKLYYSKQFYKLEEFLSIIEVEKKMITTKDKRKFKNGEKYSYFWINNKDIIIELINISTIKKRYPEACKIVKTAYNYNQATFDEKCLNYIEIINRNKSLLKSSDKMRLNCGIVAVSFGRYYSSEIYKLISQEEMIKQYPIAYQLLMTKKMQDEIKNKVDRLSFEQKCLELYSLIEKIGTMINQKNEYKFSDGTYVKSLLMNNRELIYKFILKEEYKQQYPIAYNILTNDYQKYNKRKERKLRGLYER